MKRLSILDACLTCVCAAALLFAAVAVMSIAVEVFG